ncbi:MAG: acyl-CoA thioesterase [Bacteroidota bacterium]
MAWTTKLRVRYQETDAMGVAYYGNYLTWFEVARTEFMRELGLTYRSWEEQGFFLPVTEAGCRYHKPARYDDELALTATLTARGVVFHFAYEVRRADELLATGWTDHVCLNRQGQIDRAATKRLQKLVGCASDLRRE